MVDADVDILTNLCAAQDRPISPIKEDEVKRLKDDKTMDRLISPIKMR